MDYICYLKYKGNISSLLNIWRNLDSLQRQKAALNQVLSLHNEFYQDTRLI